MHSEQLRSHKARTLCISVQDALQSLDIIVIEFSWQRPVPFGCLTIVYKGAPGGWRLAQPPSCLIQRQQRP